MIPKVHIGSCGELNEGNSLVVKHCFEVIAKVTKELLYWLGTTAKNSSGPPLLLMREWACPLGQ